MHRALNRTVKEMQLEDKTNWHYDSGRTLGEQDKWCEAKVQQATEMIMWNADQRKPVRNLLSNSIIKYDTESSKIAKQVEKRAHDLIEESDKDETRRIGRRLASWGRRDVHDPSDDEEFGSAGDRLAANRARPAGKTSIDPITKEEAKR